MAQRRLASSPARPGRQRPQLAVPLAVVLGAVGIVAVLLSSGPVRDAEPPSSPSAESWNSRDRAYVLAMLWHQQQALELASLVQGRTSRPELRRLALSIRTTQTSDVDRIRHGSVPAIPPLVTTSSTRIPSPGTDGSLG